MVVTALLERPRGRVEVELDGAPWRVLPVDVVVRAELAVGRTLDRATARILAQELRRADALARATRALAARDRSRRALEQRLERAGVPDATRDDALGALERVGLVDDARVARTRAATLAGRGYGDAAIRFDLEREGLSAEAIAEAVAGIDSEPERARRLLDQGGCTPRTLRRLAARGFDAATLEDLGGFAAEA
ncbi:MAG TPA: RecX family transcriptional regulator [Gaiellaceae bacterium]|nr:RecX family transcriptional regulator [Gaiellaceae bacterium]